MSFLDKLSLLFRPREKAFRRDLDDVYKGIPTVDINKFAEYEADKLDAASICSVCGKACEITSDGFFKPVCDCDEDNPPHADGETK